MTEKKTRWGILGSGKIASDLSTAILHLEDECEIGAVAARSLDSAKEFAQKFGIEKYYGSYEELASDSTLDIIYISVLHPWHYSTALICLKNGKNVLCEKPITMNAKQMEHLVAVAREKNVFFMEAMWTRYFPYVQKIREILQSEVLGEIKLFQAQFGCSPPQQVTRVNDPRLGGGALLDVGIYTMSFSSMIFGGEYPSKIFASGIVNDGVDTMETIILDFASGKRSVQHVSIQAKTENTATISGTKGWITVHAPFNCSTGFTLNVIGAEKKLEKTVYDFPLPAIKEGHKFNFTNGIGMVHEVQYVRKLLLEGRKESDLESLQESLDIMKILDEVRSQIGLEYPADKEVLSQ